MEQSGGDLATSTSTSTSISLVVQGHQTEIIISGYADHILAVATQIGTMGTILHAWLYGSVSLMLLDSILHVICTFLNHRPTSIMKEEGLAVDPTFNVTVVFGKRNEPMLVACARQIIQHMSDTGSSKALVLSLGLRDHSMETMKAIVSAIIEKLPEAS